MKTRTHRQRRRRRSGIALTEALIAASLMIILFASVVFFHNVYFAKTRALRAARMQAWLATDQSCQSQGHGKGAFDAAVPTPYVRVKGKSMSLAAGMEMTCNEHNSTHPDLLSVMEWAGLGNPIDDLFKSAAEAMF